MFASRYSYANMQNLEVLSRPDLMEATIARCGGDITTAEVRKVTQMIFKAKLVTILGTNEDGETLWQIAAISEEEMIRRVDLAMVVRLIAPLDELGVPLEQARIAPLFLVKRTGTDIDALVKEARSLSRVSGQDNDA